MKKASLYCLLLAVICMASCRDRLESPGAESSALNGQLMSVDSTRFSNPDSLLTSSFSTGYDLFNTVKDILLPVYQKLAQEQVEKLDEMFEDKVGLAPDGHRQWRLEVCYFSYRSQSARGEDIVLSGLMVFPNNTLEGVDHTVKAFRLDSHMAGGDPSPLARIKQDLLSLQTLDNSAIIMPFYQGYGNTFGKETFCYVSSDVLARQMADCAIAAVEVMRQRGVSLASYGYSLCQGISEGAAASVAFAKWYETKAPQAFKEQIRLKATLSGCGPQDFSSMFWYLSEHPEFYAHLSSRVVNSLPALPEQMLGGYSAVDYLSDVLKNTIVTAPNGVPMPYCEAVGKFAYNAVGMTKGAPSLRHLSDILAPDMLTAEGKLDAQSPKTKAFMRILAEQNSLLGWSPSLPIYFIASPQDDGDPYDVSHEFYQALSAHGANTNVHWGKLRIPPILASILHAAVLGANHGVACITVNLKQSVLMNYEDFVDNWEN